MKLRIIGLLAVFTTSCGPHPELDSLGEIGVRVDASLGLDAGPVDLSPPDMGPMGRSDTGSQAGIADAGPSMDAGQPMDAGTPDAGFPQWDGQEQPISCQSRRLTFAGGLQGLNGALNDLRLNFVATFDDTRRFFGGRRSVVFADRAPGGTSTFLMRQDLPVGLVCTAAPVGGSREQLRVRFDAEARIFPECSRFRGRGAGRVEVRSLRSLLIDLPGRPREMLPAQGFVGTGETSGSFLLEGGAGVFDAESNTGYIWLRTDGRASAYCVGAYRLQGDTSIYSDIYPLGTCDAAEASMRTNLAACASL